MPVSDKCSVSKEKQSKTKNNTKIFFQSHLLPSDVKLTSRKVILEGVKKNHLFIENVFVYFQ